MTDTRNTQSAPPGRSLRRSNEHKILAGVSGGLGEHLGINAWWLRWAFIFLAFAGGAGVLLYIVAWVFIPEADQEETAVSHWLSNLDLTDTGTILGVVLIGSATLILATSVFDISGTMVTAAVLFAVGLLLYRGGLMPPPRSDASPEGGVPKTDEEIVEEDDAPSPEMVDGAVAVVPGPTAELPETKPPAAPRPPRERSMLGRLTLAIGLIVVSGMALLDLSGISVGSVDSGEFFDPVHYVIAALLVLAGGLIVGAFVGRARWLFVVGLLLLPVLFVATLWPRSFPWTAGDVAYQPLSVLEVENSFELGAGQLTVDLSLLTPEELEEIGLIKATLGVGELRIFVPEGVGFILRGDVGLGDIEVPGPGTEGIGISIDQEFGQPPFALTIDAEVGAGQLSVRIVERISR